MEAEQSVRGTPQVSGVTMAPEERMSTGVAGLDEVLTGGLLTGQTYLVRGGPGCGKTTLGLHFLTQGALQGEPALFITMGEPEAELRRNASSQGFDLAGVSFLDLSPAVDVFAQNKSYDIFTPAEVEPGALTKQIMVKVDEVRPRRIFLDSMTQFRYLSPDVFQFRKQVLSFLRYLLGQGATVLFSSEGSTRDPDDDLQFIADGIIHLDFGQGDRLLSVSKFRGSRFRSGSHSLQLTAHGMEVFPRLIPASYRRTFEPEQIASGVPSLDEMLHGGLERGTITFVTGPSGCGKTTIGIQFMKEAAGRGERSVVYTFEEEVDLIVHRCESVSIPAKAMIERGSLALSKVEPLKYTADEFARLVRREVEEKQARIVMLDSVAGYRLVLAGDDLVSHLHALCKYLQNMGVAVILINENSNVTGDFRVTESNISYLADNVLYLRYLERLNSEGALELRKGIGVLKKRASDFGKSMRELEITRYGLRVGEPMIGLSSLLSELPSWRPTQSGTTIRSAEEQR